VETLLVWVANRFRPPRGWVAFFLTLAAMICLPAALILVADKSAMVHPLSRVSSIKGAVLALALLGTLCGLALARTRIPGFWAMILGALLGGALAAVIIGRLSPPWSMIWTEIRALLDWFRLRQQGALGWPFPFAPVVAFLSDRLSELGIQLWWDTLAVVKGGALVQTRAYLLIAASLIWVQALHGTWQIYRRRAALTALLPSGVALAFLAFFHPVAAFYFFVFLFCVLWLIAICHLWTHRDRWKETGADYPEDLGTEMVISLGPWILVLLLAAGLFPNRGFWTTSRVFWQQAERVFGPFEDANGAGSGQQGILPRTHLLGGRPELAETVVLYVTTSDPPPPLATETESQSAAPLVPRRYWRSDTLDAYTGQGWMSSPMEATVLSPNEHLEPATLRGPMLSQRFERVSAASQALIAANAPGYLDAPALAWWRSVGDLARLTGDASRYSVTSWTPEPTAADLRMASPLLPTELADRYLALPETVPRRVTQLAQHVIESAENRYDQARAIETFLRAYPYTLDVPEPPNQRDLVDYFLFDLQKGYCDYYASAMVVMARAVGIPARFATGYSQGEYDQAEGRWVVTESNGHSWVEIYFDGIGWVEFEPTAGLPALDRPGVDVQARPSVPPLPSSRLTMWIWIPWTLGIALAAFGLLMALAMGLRLRVRRSRALPADIVRDLYTRLRRWDSRLNLATSSGQTAHEHAAALATLLRARGQYSRWSRLRRAATTAPSEVERLSRAYVSAQYGKSPITHREAASTHDAWLRLRRHLWWYWLAPH
jgi:transglutaminase-like putative cysteine protease